MSSKIKRKVFDILYIRNCETGNHFFFNKKEYFECHCVINFKYLDHKIGGGKKTLDKNRVNF